MCIRDRVMGSAVYYMGVNSTVPVFILKDPILRGDKENKHYRFACCTDGSVESMKAIDFICKMRKPDDLIEVICCD